MNKLTRQEAQDLIKKAWQDVSDYNLGSWRFCSCLWTCLMNHMNDKLKTNYYYQIKDFYELCLEHKDCIAFNSDSDKVTEAFYKYFVQVN